MLNIEINGKKGEAAIGMAGNLREICAEFLLAIGKTYEALAEQNGEDYAEAFREHIVLGATHPLSPLWKR